MESWWTSLIVGTALAVVGAVSFLTILYYLREVWINDFREFIASILSVVVGFTLYALAKVQGVGLGIEGQWEGIEAMLRQPGFWLTVLLAAVCGWLFAGQLRSYRPASYRWILILMCWSVALVSELILAVLFRHGQTRALFLGACFTVALCLVAVARIPSSRYTIEPNDEVDGDAPEFAEEEGARTSSLNDSHAGENSRDPF